MVHDPTTGSRFSWAAARFRTRPATSLSLAQTSAVSPAHRGAETRIDKMLKLQPAQGAAKPTAELEKR